MNKQSFYSDGSRLENNYTHHFIYGHKNNKTENKIVALYTKCWV